MPHFYTQTMLLKNKDQPQNPIGITGLATTSKYQHLVSFSHKNCNSIICTLTRVNVVQEYEDEVMLDINDGSVNPYQIPADVRHFCFLTIRGSPVPLLRSPATCFLTQRGSSSTCWRSARKSAFISRSGLVSHRRSPSE